MPTITIGQRIMNIATNQLDTATTNAAVREPDSVGTWMSTHLLAVRDEVTAGQARTQIRAEWRDAATIVYVFVIDDQQRPVGVVTFRDLMLAPGGDPVADMMVSSLVTVAPEDDQETAARLLGEYNLAALPVVSDGVLVGIITADQMADVMEVETTEDAEKQGGSEALGVSYLRASVWTLWRKRVIWLLVLFAAEAYTSTVLQYFEDELDKAVVLSFFIPLLIDSGGNIGTQITTTLVRAMTVGDVQFRDLGRVFRKEIATASLIGLPMAGAAFIRAWTLGVGLEIMLTVMLSVFAILVWSAAVSSVLPAVLRRFNVDPAVVSGPLITTLVDGTGLIIYFQIASLVVF